MFVTDASPWLSELYVAGFSSILYEKEFKSSVWYERYACTAGLILFTHSWPLHKYQPAKLLIPDPTLIWIGSSDGAVTADSVSIKLELVKKAGSTETIVPIGTTPPISSTDLKSIVPSVSPETAILPTSGADIVPPIFKLS